MLNAICFHMLIKTWLLWQ